MLLLQKEFQLFRYIRTTLIKEILSLDKRTIVFYEEAMPKSKEYLSSDNSDSEEEKAPKRKSKEEDKEKAQSSKKPKKQSKEEEEEPSWELGNNRFVKIREFKGKMYVDIREMYFDNSGDMKPGKKGISMNMPQWRKFMDQVEEIDKVAKAKC